MIVSFAGMGADARSGKQIVKPMRTDNNSRDPRKSYAAP